MKSCLNILFICLILMSACNNKPKIGFLMDTLTIKRWEKDKQLFEQKAKELGAIPFIKVADNNADRQLEQAKELLNNEVDVLVVIPCDLVKAGDIVKLAHEHDVPVISYDRLIKDCNLDYYISTDNINIGELQADYISKIAPVGKYALIAGSTADNNAFLLHLGWMNILQPLIDKGDINVVMEEFTDFWLPDESYKLMHEFLSKGGEVDAIIAGNDALASGAIMALQEHNHDGKVLVAGQDADINAVRNIVAGTQTITIYKPIESLVHATISAAIKMTHGEAPSNMNLTVNNGKRLVPAILLKAQVVNRQNIKMTVISEGFIEEKELVLN